jgi:hypothetical protein
MTFSKLHQYYEYVGILHTRNTLCSDISHRTLLHAGNNVVRSVFDVA